MILLSYPLSRNVPLYPNTPEVEYRRFRTMAGGDSSDHTIVSLSCHTGTHIDTPRHFCPQGHDLRESIRPVNDFSPAYCIDLPSGPGDSIGPEVLKSRISPEMAGARALLIRTGWFVRRAQEPEAYASENPWIEESTADFLRARCPEIRLIGLDTISVGNIHHRDAGRAAHRALLCGKKPVLILEDADLSATGIIGGPLRIRVIPLLIDAVEATPVVALAELMDTGIANRRKNQLPQSRKAGRAPGEHR